MRTEINNIEKDIEKLDNQTIKQLNQESKNSLYFFTRGILGQNFMYPNLHIPICEFIEQNYLNSTLLIILPRGFLKSTLVSFTFPLWLSIKHGSNIRSLIAGNTLINAGKFGRKLKLTIQLNKLFRVLFPELLPKNINKQKWSDYSICLNREIEHQESTFEFASVGTNITSRHYNIVIGDDLLAPKKDQMTGQEIMPTIEEVEKCIGWYKLLDSIFIHDPEMPNIKVIAGTRWCKYDLIQYVKDTEINLKIFDCPALIEGKSTYPTRFSNCKLEQIKKNQGTYIFSGQYMNQPYDPDKMVFKPEYLRYYTTYPSDLYKIISCDPAWSKRKQSCFTAIPILGMDKERNIYVLEYVRKHLNPSELVQMVFNIYKKYGDIKKISMETTGAQKIFIDLFEIALRDELAKTNTYLPIVESKPISDKKERISTTLEPIITQGKFYIHKDMTELEQELLDFPAGKYVDLLDAICQGIQVLKPSNTFSVEDNYNKNSLTLDSILKELDEKYYKQDTLFPYQNRCLQILNKI